MGKKGEHGVEPHCGVSIYEVSWVVLLVVPGMV